MMKNKQTKRKIKQGLSLLCIFGILLSFVLPNSVSAEKDSKQNESTQTSLTSDMNTNDKKSEVIYASLGSDGTAKEIYIVNRFASQTAGELSEYGDYSSVQSLTMYGDVKLNADKIEISKGSENFYYKGKLTRDQLPWKFSFTHKLNGQEIKPEGLSGASGKWELAINVKPNSQLSDDQGENIWAKNSLIQISLTLADSVAENITITNGMVAEAGSNQIVNFTILPNAENSDFSVEAEISDFYLPAIQIAATPFSEEMFSFEMPDFDENEDITTLQDATKLLSEGSRELADGIKELNAGVTELEAALDLIDQGGVDLATGGQNLASGVDEYTSGVSELAENSSDLRSGAEDSATGASELSIGLNTANQGLTQYTTGVSSYVDGVSQLISGISELNGAAEEIINGADQIAEGFTGLSGGNQLTDGSNEIAGAIKSMSDGVSQLGTAEERDSLALQLSNLNTQIDQFSTDLSDISEEMTELKDGLEDIINGLSLVNDSISSTALSGYLQSLQEQGFDFTEDKINADLMVQSIFAYLEHEEGPRANLTSLINGLTVIKNNINTDSLTTIEGSLASLSQVGKLAGLLELAGGIISLNNEYSTFNAGLGSYIDGVNQLSFGYKNDDPNQPDFYGGLTQYFGGISQIAEGGSGLSDGGVQLQDTAALTTGYEQLGTGLGMLSDGLSDLSSGVAGYTGGVDTLADNSATLSSGVQDYTDGTSELSSGLTELSTGFTEFSDGVTQLETGSAELADGAEELHKGTLTMDENINAMVDDLMAEYQSDEPMPSFASAKNPTPAKVQFVIMSEPIPKKAEPEPLIEAEPDKNIWERFLDLFR
ncbi:MAG TPA: hypothetical protein GXZ43_05170 [Clostridiaceae bacterium]|nr:hypothetical protein [Clostridiaceae bacterium]